MKWVYLAGPMSGSGLIHRNLATAAELWEKLRQLEFHPIAPQWSMIQDMLFPVEWEDWLQYDFETILKCDFVFRLPGESPGADREVHFAGQHRIPVVYSIARLKELAGHA